MQVMGMGQAKAAESPLPTGRLLTYHDVSPGLKGRQAEVNLPLQWCFPSCTTRTRMVQPLLALVFLAHFLQEI